MCGHELVSFLPPNETWHHSAPQSTEGSQDPQTPSFWRTKAVPTHQPLSLERQRWAQRGEGDCAHPRWSDLFHHQSYTVLVGLLACLLFQGFEWRKLDCSDCPILECDIPFVYFFIMDLKEYLFDCRVLVAAHRLFLASRGTLRSGADTLVVERGLSCPLTCGILVSRSGIEHMLSALQGRFFTTAPSRKSWLTSSGVSN